MASTGLRAASCFARVSGELREAAQAPYQDVVHVLGGVEFAHVDGLLEEGLGVVACLLCVRKGGGQGIGPRRRGGCSRPLFRQGCTDRGLVSSAFGFGQGAALVV